MINKGAAKLFICLFILSVTFVPVGWAQEQAEINATTLCKEKVIPVIQEEFQALTTWLEQHFKNEKPNRELLAQAIQRLKQFETKMIVHLNEVFVIQQGEEIIKATIAYQRCAGILLDVQDQTRAILREAVPANAKVKQTIAIVSKYKDINSRLRRLNQDVAYFKGYMTTLNSKVPCYVSQCLR